MNQVTRRTFLGAAAATAIVPYFVPSTVLGKPGQVGANEKIVCGLIGLGGRCHDLYANAIRNVDAAKVVACSDPFLPKVNNFLAGPANGHGLKGYDDFREMIEKEKLDGIFAETATHQRAWVSIISMQMGCHAYIEKPMALTISEGREMVKAARKFNRVTQVGTQQRSLPLCRWASKLVQDGAFGKIRFIRAPNFVGPNIWQDQPGEPLPEGGKEGWWDTWTNQAVYRPFHGQLFYNWSNWWDYDAGGLCFGVSGWGTHSYDQVNMTMGYYETGPTEITLLEEPKIEKSGKYPPRKIDDDETGADYYRMAEVTGPRGKINMKFADGVELRLELDADWGPGLGAIFHGDKGRIEINRHKVSSSLKELTAKVPEEAQNGPGHLETVAHVKNWTDCIKSGKKCNADIEYGQRSTTICELVNITRAVKQVNKTLHWDPKAEKFTDCPEGNKLLARERRKGWELPDLG